MTNKKDLELHGIFQTHLRASGPKGKKKYEFPVPPNLAKKFNDLGLNGGEVVVFKEVKGRYLIGIGQRPDSKKAEKPVEQETAQETENVPA